MNKFWGKVKKGFGRGKDLGFPTANIRVNKNFASGIYISKTKVEENIYPSLTFIGEAKTFEQNKFQAEVYILDFKGKLYEKWISVELLKKIRANKEFKSTKDLTLQMKKDEQAARDFFIRLKRHDPCVSIVK